MPRASEAKLYVVVEARTAAQALQRLLARPDIAAVLIEGTADVALDAAGARPLVEMAQQKGIAALINDDAALARTLRADGVHLPWSKEIARRFAEARDILGNRYIVGADAGRSRHDAMTLGEAGADYVGFGIPAHVEDREAARARRLDLIGWWSEIFEVPGVAFDVETPEDAGALVLAGADFIAVRAPSGAVEARTALLHEFATAIGAQEGVA